MSWGFDIPPLDSDTRSVVVVLTSEREDRQEFFAVDLAQGRFRVERSQTLDFSVRVLLYRRPLTRIGLRPGPLTLANATSSARRAPLPSPVAVLLARALSDDDWQRSAQMPDDLAVIEFDSISVPECLKEAGCFTEEPGVSVPICQVPCPEPPVPQPPDAVQPPQFLPCRAGWLEDRTNDDLTFCVPSTAPNATECPSGQAAFPSTSQCVPLAACPADGIPQDIPPNRAVVYVDPQVPDDGDGSRLTPFSSLVSALTETSSGSIVVL